MFTDRLGAELKSRRLALGLSRRELASLAGLDADFIERVERARNLSTLRKVSKLASALVREEAARARSMSGIR